MGFYEQDWGEAVEQEAKGRRENEFVEADH